MAVLAWRRRSNLQQWQAGGVKASLAQLCCLPCLTSPSCSRPHRPGSDLTWAHLASHRPPCLTPENRPGRRRRTYSQAGILSAWPRRRRPAASSRRRGNLCPVMHAACIVLEQGRGWAGVSQKKSPQPISLICDLLSESDIEPSPSAWSRRKIILMRRQPPAAVS